MSRLSRLHSARRSGSVTPRLGFAVVLAGVMFGAHPLDAQQSASDRTRQPASDRAQQPTSDYYVYVAAESDDEVAVVRYGPAGIAVVESIPVGLFPTEIDGAHGIAVTPDGSRWAVSIAHGLPYGQIQVYEVGTNRRVGAVDAGLFPATMQATKGDLLFVANFNLHGDRVPSTISVIDLGSLVEIAQITTCAMPHGSRLNASATRHYSACMMDEQVVEIDARTLQVSRRLFVRPGHEQALSVDVTDAVGSAGPSSDGTRCGPTWVQVSPDGASLYVACNKNREVLEVDLDQWTVARRFPTGAGPYNLEVSPDGRLMVVTFKSDQATGIFDLQSGEMRATVENTRRLPHGVVISPDSRYAFVSVEGVGGEPGTVDVIDLDTGARVASVGLGKQAGGIGFWKQEPAGSI